MGYVAASQQAVNLAAADVARLYDAEVDNTFGVPVVSVLGRRGPLGGNARGVHSDGHAAGGHLDTPEAPLAPPPDAMCPHPDHREDCRRSAGVAWVAARLHRQVFLSGGDPPLGVPSSQHLSFSQQFPARLWTPPG